MDCSEAQMRSVVDHDIREHDLRHDVAVVSVMTHSVRVERAADALHCGNNL
jgi:hypothetical protein